MGKCNSIIRRFRNDDNISELTTQKIMLVEDTQEKSNQRRMKKIELINNWQSHEIETIVEKIIAMCEYQKKNHMNFTLFLEFFPALKPMSMKTQLKYFDLFDFTKSSYINIREIIFGISQIYFTPRGQYSQILKEIYKRTKENYLTYGQLKLFFSQNPDMFDPAQQKKILETKKGIQESDFDLKIAKHFNIEKYHRYFDFYDANKERSILDNFNTRKDNRQMSHDVKNIGISHDKDKKVGIYNFIIKNNDRVFLVDKEWFEYWVKFMSNSDCYGIIIEVYNTFEIQHKQTYDIKKDFFFDEVFMDNSKHMRPSKIYNYELLSQYQTDIKPQLRMFEDFVILPEKVWKDLSSIYKGGPQIQRVYPFVFDTIVINKVFIDNKGKFIEGKSVKCILHSSQVLGQLFKIQKQYGNIYFRRVPISSYIDNASYLEIKQNFKWEQLDQNIKVNRFMHQGFACFVIDSSKKAFQANYKCFGPCSKQQQYIQIKKQNQYSYGQVLNFKTHTYVDTDYEQLNQFPNDFVTHYKFNLAYIIDMRKTEVKIHFVGVSDTCDSYYSIEQLKQAVRTPDTTIVKNKNVICAFDGLQNCSYINAVLQALIATPFFSDYFLKQKHIRSLSNRTHLQSCLSTHLSKVIYDIKKHQKQTIKPDSFYKKIQSKIQKIDFNVYNKQYAQIFLSNFLDFLSKQLDRPQKLFDKYQVVQTSQLNRHQDQDNNRGSIIEAFFKLSQSSKSICYNCNGESITTQSAYILNVPLPQDQEVCYSITFYPLNNKQFKKYAITIRKSQKFLKYAIKFASLVNKQVGKICFAQIQQNQFRKHYTQFDYDTSLFNLDLNPTDKIIAFELKNQLSNKQIQQSSESINTSIFQKLKLGDIVDFNIYSQWHVGKVINISKDKVLVQNFEGQTEVERKRVDEFKQKTEQKDWYQIDLLHRQMDHRKNRIEYFMTPSIISVAGWMSWSMLFDIVIEHVKLYFDNFGQQDLKNEEVVNRMILQTFMQAVGQKSHRNLHDSADSAIQLQKKFDEDSMSRASKIQSTQVQDSKFKIKIFFKNSGQICAICSKKSMIQKQNQVLDKKYCYGCIKTIDEEQPLTVKVNPAKISIVLDWKLAQNNDQPQNTESQIQKLRNIIKNKTSDDHTFNQAMNKIKNQVNTIDYCFQLYVKTKKKVQIYCKNCGRSQGQQTRYLSQCPNILAIHLKRFKTSKSSEDRLNNKIQFKRQISVQKIQMQSKKQDIYQLYALICHRQKKNIQKWYSCILKSRNIWIKCEDSYTTLIDFSKIYKEDIYMAFYRKKNIKCTILSMVF